MSFHLMPHLHEILEAGFAAVGNKGFDFLRTCTSGDHEGVGHVDNDKIVYT